MSNTVTVNTCTKHCVKECPYFEIECNTFYSDMLGHKYYACTHLNICEKALALKEKEEQEEPKEPKKEPKEPKKEPKSDAEKFIDNLLETLVLRSKSLEFTDMWAISNTMLGYVDGKKAMIKDVIKIIEEYKENK